VIDAFDRSMQEESDRARVLLAVTWMGYFLTCRLNTFQVVIGSDGMKRLCWVSKQSSTGSQCLKAFSEGILSDGRLTRKAHGDL